MLDPSAMFWALTYSWALQIVNVGSGKPRVWLGAGCAGEEGKGGGLGVRKLGMPPGVSCCWKY